MKITKINGAGQWGFWDNKKKEELKKGKTNTNVGEHLVLENNRVKVWTIHLPPGQKLPFHKHDKPYFWTALVDGKARSHYDDGSVMEVIYSQNDCRFFADLSPDNFFVHNLENTGDTTLIFSTVEILG